MRLPFFNGETMKIVNVMAVSLDGLIASNHHETDNMRREKGFVNDADKEFVRTQLGFADAVICGRHSMAASKRIWEVLNVKGTYPEWYIFSNKGLDTNLEFWKQEKITRFIVSKMEQKIDEKFKNVLNLNYFEKDPAQYIFDFLSARKHIENVVLFGGGYINQMFYQRKLVDELKVTICPFILGSKDPAKFVEPSLDSEVELELTSSHIIQNHVFLSYIIKKKIKI